jgi:hypothetical protein
MKTRDDVVNDAMEAARNSPDLPPAPPSIYYALNEYQKYLNRRPYNPDLFPASELDAARKAGYLKGKNAKFTDDGRAKLSEWKRVEDDRNTFLWNLSDKLVDDATTKWDRENDPVTKFISDFLK